MVRRVLKRMFECLVERLVERLVECLVERVGDCVPGCLDRPIVDLVVERAMVQCLINFSNRFVMFNHSCRLLELDTLSAQSKQTSK